MAEHPRAIGGPPELPRGPAHEVRCANPNCHYLVHSSGEFGVFCCGMCWCRHTRVMKGRSAHGEFCERIPASHRAQQTVYVPTAEDMAVIHEAHEGLPALPWMPPAAAMPAITLPRFPALTAGPGSHPSSATPTPRSADRAAGPRAQMKAPPAPPPPPPPPADVPAVEPAPVEKKKPKSIFGLLDQLEGAEAQSQAPALAWEEPSAASRPKPPPPPPPSQQREPRDPWASWQAEGRRAAPSNEWQEVEAALARPVAPPLPQASTREQPPPPRDAGESAWRPPPPPPPVRYQGYQGAQQQAPLPPPLPQPRAQEQPPPPPPPLPQPRTQEQPPPPPLPQPRSRDQPPPPPAASHTWLGGEGQPIPDPAVKVIWR